MLQMHWVFSRTTFFCFFVSLGKLSRLKNVVILREGPAFSDSFSVVDK